MASIRKWFFGLSESSIDRHNHGWRGLVRVAVRSCQEHTDLIPHMLYDGALNDFTDEMQQNGVTIIKHRVGFYDALERRGIGTPGFAAIASGAYLRVDLPLVETEDQYVLYTDCDVVSRSPARGGGPFQVGLTDYVTIGDVLVGKRPP